MLKRLGFWKKSYNKMPDLDPDLYLGLYSLNLTTGKLFSGISSNTPEEATLIIKKKELIIKYQDKQDVVSFFSILMFSCKKDCYAFTTQDNLSHYFTNPYAVDIFELIYSRCLALSK